MSCLYNPLLHGLLLINQPQRDGRLSSPCWLTTSRRLNHKVVTHPASSLEQDRESSPAETSVLTTMLRRQLMKRVGDKTGVTCHYWTATGLPSRTILDRAYSTQRFSFFSYFLSFYFGSCGKLSRINFQLLSAR